MLVSGISTFFPYEKWKVDFWDKAGEVVCFVSSSKVVKVTRVYKGVLLMLEMHFHHKHVLLLYLLYFFLLIPLDHFEIFPSA